MSRNLLSYFKKIPSQPSGPPTQPKVPESKTLNLDESPAKNLVGKMLESPNDSNFTSSSSNIVTQPPAKVPERNYRNLDLFDESEFDLPSFLTKSSIMDAQKRRPGDPEYDPSTLYIPPSEKFTPAMTQYWEIKKQHFDKILLFKLGKFYEIFWIDAIKVQGLLDLKWVGDQKKKAHVGFPEKTLEKNAAIMVANGLKVVVVEQTEITLKNRIQKAGKVVGREVTEVLTRSTFPTHYMSDNFEPLYLLSVVEEGGRFGVTLGDLATAEIAVGECSVEEFRNLISTARPAECVYNYQYIGGNTLKMLKGLPVQPTLTNLKITEQWNPVKIFEYFDGGLPDSLEQLAKHTSIRSFVGFCAYLKSALIFEKIIPIANFSIYTPEVVVKRHMILDSEALDHLEILESSYSKEKTYKGSLFEFINKCVTPFGKRMLKKWLTAPLLNPVDINKRLDAVTDLIAHKDVVKYFDRATHKLPDLERVFARLAALSIKTNSKAVYFENISATQLKDLNSFLKQAKLLEQLMNSFETMGIESELLMSITLTQFPKVSETCDKLMNLIHWNNKGEPEPVRGFIADFDAVKEEIDEVDQKLQSFLIQERRRFSNNPEINLVDSKFRYELEVPTYLIQKAKPDEYEETSARNGFQRYYTKELKRLADDMEITEDKLKNTLKPFVMKIMGMFYSYESEWKALIRLVSEFDCLCSLAKLATGVSFQMTRPFFSDIPKELEIQSLVHPIIANKVESFITNDLTFSESNHCYVLTGPNMGGKSTILRQVCIAVILAQIGSFVPAAFMSLKPVDYIFTRIGASDSLFEGKSTFFMEMQEAAKFFRKGTADSLVIMDELGRGTSTEDGSSIALATLNSLGANLKPRAIFTTHYHMILADVREITGLRLMHMDSILDKETKTLTYLYKLKDGECPKSFGLNVARAAGISEAILNVAEKKAEEMEAKMKLALVGVLLRRLKREGVANPLEFVKTFLE